jgi:hypothetical protein
MTDDELAESLTAWFTQQLRDTARWKDYCKDHPEVAEDRVKLTAEQLKHDGILEPVYILWGQPDLPETLRLHHA